MHPQIVEERRGTVSVWRKRHKLRTATDGDTDEEEAFAHTLCVDGREQVNEFVRDGKLAGAARTGAALVGRIGKSFWSQHIDRVWLWQKGVVQDTGVVGSETLAWTGGLQACVPAQEVLRPVAQIPGGGDQRPCRRA